MKKKLLVIEDEKSVAKQLRWGLDDDYDITIASDVKQAERMLLSGAFPVATLDLGLPPYPDTPKKGFEILQTIAPETPFTKIIVITGNSENENAVRAISLGASDFCSKPIDLDVLKIILSRTFKLYELEAENRRLAEETSQTGSFFGMIGTSKAMTRVFELLKLSSTNDFSVLITGKTGTGKEMAAHALHSMSDKADKPLVIINCGAIPENLLESELFGHEKGAFTGAVCRKTGKFEIADQGTLFLDEVGELPLTMQVKLLRFLQESTIERVGGTKTIQLNVRTIAATNIDLKNAVENGTFREDLYYRLNVIEVKLPDLTERPEDILLLANHFLAKEAGTLKRYQTAFTASAIEALINHDWPGNVRELQNKIRRALGSSVEKFIQPADLGLHDGSTDSEDNKIISLKKARENAEIEAVRKALTLCDNNISNAAKLLEVSRPTLHDLIKKHRIIINK